MENMTSPASNNKAPYRGVASSPNSRVHWQGGGGGGVHLIVQQTTLNISDFLVRKSSRRQIANFVNYPGDWRHESGDQKMRLKIWRLPGYPGELTAPEASHTCNFLQKN